MAKLRIAVIFGGVSSEHEVSLMSATSVISNLPRDKYEVITVGITKKGRMLLYPGDPSAIESGAWETDSDCVPTTISADRRVHGLVNMLSDGSFTNLKVDAVFPVLHGKNGEDGTIQGLCHFAGIPCVGCGALASAVCMDKAVAKTMLTAAGINNTPYLTFIKSETDDFAPIEDKVSKILGYPVFVKPANSGSSVGVNKASNAEELKMSVNLAKAHDSKIIVEKAINCREIEAAVVGNNAPYCGELGEILSSNDFYDYDAKYLLGTSKTIIPANIEPATSDEIKRLAIKAYKTLGCEGFARVDFFLTSDNTILLNEINTIPGFTSISMFPKMIMATGKSYPALLDELITLALNKEDVTR